MTRSPLICLLVVALLAGCGSQDSDRAGGDAPVKAKVLTMANANHDLGELEAFDAAVKRVSAGRLRIKWLNQYVRGRDGNAEVNLIRAVAAGKADLGWAGTRVFDLLGDPAFNPLHAPMLIDSYALQEKVVGDAVVDPMLDSLADLDLQGIGVLPGPLRRPLAKRPLRGPEDWDGARISYSGGKQAESALQTLGASVRYDHPSRQEPTDGFDGIETHVTAVPGNHYHRYLPYLTGNVVLWPRPLVLFAGPDVAGDDLAVLREAAKAAVPEVIAWSRAQESEQLAEICRSTLKVVDASPTQVERLRAAFQPVVDGLENDPGGSRAVARIRELTAESEAEDPLVCPAEAELAEASQIPAGTYRAIVTRADAKEHGMSWSFVVNEDPDPKALRSKTREYRLEFTEQGAYTVGDVQLDGTATIGWEGTYSIYRDRITVTGNDGDTVTARVDIDGDRLRFTDVRPGPEGPYALTWGSKPFTKIR